MRVLDLFSGIGGFSLGLERTGGFTTAAFCEIDPFARRVLAKHWPEVPCYDDVRTLTADRLSADGVSVDVICGGFPCQDISVAGAGAGLDGARSGLWFEYLRLIGELRPQWVIAENVSALRSRGLDQVLRGLASVGYDAEWHCIPAAALGAPHRRDRIWIVAYPHSEWERQQAVSREAVGIWARDGRQAVADTDGLWVRGQGSRPDAGSPRGMQGETQQREWLWADVGTGGPALVDTYRPRLEIVLPGEAGQCAAAVGAHSWAAEPDVGRMAYGVPGRVDRLRTLGNAVVPQIPELIGRAILAQQMQVAA